MGSEEKKRGGEMIEKEKVANRGKGTVSRVWGERTSKTNLSKKRRDSVWKEGTGGVGGRGVRGGATRHR